VKARDVFAAVFGRAAGRSHDVASAALPAASPRAKGSGAPRARLIAGALMALVVTLVLGVGLAAATAPAVSVENATNVEYTTADVKGHVNPEGQYTEWRFQFATEADFSNAQDGPSGATETEEDVTGSLGGLQPGTEYHLRLLASNSDGQSEEVAASTFTTKPVTAPDVSGLDNVEFHLTGMVDPNAPEENSKLSDPAKAAYETHWWFSCEPGCGFSGASEGVTAADDAAEEVSADVDPASLIPNQSYAVTLHATNAGGEDSETKAGAFATPAVKPTIDRATLREPTQTSIVLTATVNPHNATLSDCHFAYGSGGGLDQTIPCDSLPGGEGNTTVSAELSGLTPATEYHFQLIAANIAGTTEGEVRSFTTLAETAPESCPNEAIREAQHATNLADCRAWEMVSPVDKNGGEVFADGTSSVASTSGESFAYDSHALFGDAVGSGISGITTYLAHRTATGWLNHAVTPESRPEALQVFYAGTRTEVFSDDLSHALTGGYDLPGATDDTPERNNLYVEDTATRALRTVSVSQRGGGEDPVVYSGNNFINGKEVWGASADLQHVAWATPIQLLPADTPSGYPQPGEPPNVYTWDDGTLHLAGILPDGTLPPGGSGVDPEGFDESSYRGTMSPDGSRQTFVASPTAGAPRQLYMRIDNARTVWISEPENSSFGGKPEGIHFEGMTPDGRNLFFVTDSPLLEADTSPGPDLYRWSDGPHANLTLISNSGGAKNSEVFGGALVGMSDDGNRVYVHETNGQLRVWEDGVTKSIANVQRGAAPKLHLTLTASEPGLGRVSPDGNWLAYVGEGQMNLYNLEDDSLVSIPADPAVFPTMSQNVRFDNVGARPRFLSDDGQVFFSTRAALVPQDVNGVYDVYEYDGPTGELHLLSSGRGSEPAMFADASPSGDDVFFATRQALVASDTDGGSLDFYDARAGGGFAEPRAAGPGCAAEACQGAPAPPPSAGPISSSALRGSGNLHPRRCGKHRRRVTARGKARCVRRHRNQHKQADHNRRAGR
jgi:hypothetical protein